MYLIKTTLSLAISLACFAFNAQAGTLVTNKDAMGGINTILIEKSQARMETQKQGQYMLMQFGDKKAYAINDKQKQIVDMAAPPPKDGVTPAPATTETPVAKIKAELVKKGKGPQIAGYDTEHYQLLAEGKVCGDEYLAIKALEVAHIKDFIQGMQDFASERRKQMGGMAAMMQKRPCMLAKEQLNDQFNALGLSMRSVDKNGQVKHEITAIEADVKTDAKTFALPEGYTTTSPYEMMQKALANMAEQNKGLPMTDGKPADMQTQMENLIKQRLEQKAAETATESK